MGALTCISDYLKAYGAELGRRVVDQFPPLHQPSDPVWPAVNELKRNPFPAQALAIMGIVKRWEEARCAAAVAECGTGKDPHLIRECVHSRAREAVNGVDYGATPAG
jgi:hypothetical protein